MSKSGKRKNPETEKETLEVGIKEEKENESTAQVVCQEVVQAAKKNKGLVEDFVDPIKETLIQKLRDSKQVWHLINAEDGEVNHFLVDEKDVIPSLVAFMKRKHDSLDDECLDASEREWWLKFHALPGVLTCLSPNYHGIQPRFFHSVFQSY
jgi:hypothetical protein